jgi:hypothetical protein
MADLPEFSCAIGDGCGGAGAKFADTATKHADGTTSKYAAAESSAGSAYGLFFE